MIRDPLDPRTCQATRPAAIEGRPISTPSLPGADSRTRLASRRFRKAQRVALVTRMLGARAAGPRGRGTSAVREPRPLERGLLEPARDAQRPPPRFATERPGCHAASWYASSRAVQATATRASGIDHAGAPPSGGTHDDLRRPARRCVYAKPEAAADGSIWLPGPSGIGSAPRDRAEPRGGRRRPRAPPRSRGNRTASTADEALGDRGRHPRPGGRRSRRTACGRPRRARRQTAPASGRPSASAAAHATQNVATGWYVRMPSPSPAP